MEGGGGGGRRFPHSPTPSPSLSPVHSPPVSPHHKHSPSPSPSHSPILSQSNSPTPAHHHHHPQHHQHVMKSPNSTSTTPPSTLPVLSFSSFPAYQSTFVFPSSPSSPPLSPTLRTGVVVADRGLSDSRRRFITQVGSAVVYEAFKKYLIKVLAAENIYFWEEVQLYRNLHSPSKKKQKALHIFHTFLQPDSDYALHVDDGEAFQSIRSTLTALKNEGKDHNKSPPSPPSPPSPIPTSPTSPPSPPFLMSPASSPPPSRSRREDSDGGDHHLPDKLFDPLELGVLETLLLYLHGKFLPLYNAEKRKS